MKVESDGGFRFGPRPEVEVEVEGETYVLDLGDPALVDRMRAFSDDLAARDFDDAKTYCSQISDTVRGFFDELFGEEQSARMFAGRERNWIDEMELYAYVNSAIARSGVMARLSDAVSRYTAQATLGR